MVLSFFARRNSPCFGRIFAYQNLIILLLILELNESCTAFYLIHACTYLSTTHCWRALLAGFQCPLLHVRLNDSIDGLYILAELGVFQYTFSDPSVYKWIMRFICSQNASADCFKSFVALVVLVTT